MGEQFVKCLYFSIQNAKIQKKINILIFNMQKMVNVRK